MSNAVQPFHAFTITHNGLANRIVTGIEITEGFDVKNPPNPLPTPHVTTALWDTGATSSVITKATADQLGLTPIGTAEVITGNGRGMHNTHVVNFLLPNTVGVTGVWVTECPDDHSFGAIIGMDIISKGDLALTNVGGKTCMSFRIPSIQKIDYVEEVNRRNRALVPPGAQCPCGSGRKFKKCHGARA